ncbi:DUF2797 domain-containing protein [Capnocytophaga canimorsus]|uniref:DUF2797 domain-containing protein n=1 Tax=Capnocytophaga canimorsus TaxID=28188 RepID=UPI001AD554D1|nr:DUF2797 domain-containing protein [Capnocytophaga canimorsus]GIM58213.1 hypothetical protein CAPN007_04200 [Capnocytophaga canimorsus]
MFEGVLKKMITEADRPVRYYLQLNTDFLMMNELIGKKISIEFSHFQCLNCSRNKPLFRQGFCKGCFFEIPQAADWIMHPELSKAHLDIEDRDLTYEKQMQLQPHVVYLANSSDVKVGVTRKSQIPTRWIDQGAHQALIVAELPNRYLAGITEVALKNYVSDKTNWRKMVTNTINDINLQQIKETLAPHLPDEVKAFYSTYHQEYHIDFPVIKYPEKPISLNLLKTPYYEGVLTGIKGQYLLFEDNTIFNIRSNEGLVVRLKM